MTGQELNREQLEQLKRQYYDDQNPDGVSYGELASINEIVSDEEIIEYYAGVYFVEDDFI